MINVLSRTESLTVSLLQVLYEFFFVTSIEDKSFQKIIIGELGIVVVSLDSRYKISDFRRLTVLHITFDVNLVKITKLNRHLFFVFVYAHFY